MKKRFQISVGPTTLKLVEKYAARFRKESGMECTVVDVLESCARDGLLTRLLAAKIQFDQPLTLRK